MSELTDIWPKGVGYDTLVGYNEERYDSKKDQMQRVLLLVESWKATALRHGFSSENVRKLSCQPCDGGHQLTFLNTSSELVALKSKVQTVKVSADVDEDPKDTCVCIEICGQDLVKAQDFKFSLTVNRRPVVRVYTQYANSVSGTKVT